MDAAKARWDNNVRHLSCLHLDFHHHNLKLKLSCTAGEAGEGEERLSKECCRLAEGPCVVGIKVQSASTLTKLMLPHFCRMAGRCWTSGQRGNSRGWVSVCIQPAPPAGTCGRAVQCLHGSHEPRVSKRPLLTLQAAVQGAKHVPLYVRDEETSIGTFIKQVSTTGPLPKGCMPPC